MAQTYTLEEAARKLGIGPDELKRRHKTEWKNLRAFVDGATLRFRAQDIDELARTVKGSDPELPLGDAGGRSAEDEDAVEIGRENPRPSGSSSARLSKPPSSGRLGKPAAPPGDQPLVMPGDDFQLAPESSSKVLKKSGSDSDVKLEKKGGAAAHPPSATDEIDLDAERRAAPASGGSGKKLAGDVFPLADEPKTPRPGPRPKAPASSSEFELKLTDDSDEVELGTRPADLTDRKGDSGVALNKPNDSGVSLEKSGADEIDFELNLDERSSKKLLAGQSSSKIKDKKKPDDSDSEFELKLDDSGSDLDVGGAPAGEKRSEEHTS